MDTPQRADTRPARDPAKLPKGRTEHPLCELPRPALTGAMLDDRFEVKGRLGEGGMADLYLGSDRLLRYPVAIKILRDDSPDSRVRFLREAEVLSNVHHENLVDVVARGTVQPGGMPYTVLRYLPGEDLKTRLVEGGPLAWATVVEIGIQVADALVCLHEAGVLHRDVKPENIMWTHHTSRRVFVKLIDLGTARASLRFQGRQDRSYTPVCGPRSTAVGFAVGTREYMPPEAGVKRFIHLRSSWGSLLRPGPARRRHETICGDASAAAVAAPAKRRFAGARPRRRRALRRGGARRCHPLIRAVPEDAFVALLVVSASAERPVEDLPPASREDSR